MAETFYESEAITYGLEQAIIIGKFRRWLRYHLHNGQDIDQGRPWCKNSLPAICEECPWWTEKQVRRILDKMRESGVLVSEQRPGYDRTFWWTFGDQMLLSGPDQAPQKGRSIRPNGQMEAPKRADDICPNGHVIPEDTPEESTQRKDGADAPTPSPPPKTEGEEKNQPYTEMAKTLFQRIRRNHPHEPSTRNGHRQKRIAEYANTLRLMRERDGFSMRQLAYLIDWSTEHETDRFAWKDQIRSARNLRKHAPKLVTAIKRDRHHVQAVRFDEAPEVTTCPVCGTAFLPEPTTDRYCPKCGMHRDRLDDEKELARARRVLGGSE